MVVNGQFGGGGGAGKKTREKKMEKKKGSLITYYVPTPKGCRKVSRCSRGRINAYKDRLKKREVCEGETQKEKRKESSVGDGHQTATRQRELTPS